MEKTKDEQRRYMWRTSIEFYIQKDLDEISGEKKEAEETAGQARGG